MDENLFEKYTSHKIKEYNSTDKDTFLNFDNKILCEIDNKFIPINNIDFLHKFIIIIDFPKLGGGTNFFINSIISKYKYKQTFLIFRNFKNIIKIFINDEYELNKNFDDKSAFEYLNHNKHKILKIFVNHIIGHSVEFVNNIFELGKKMICITHDHALILKKPQNYYHNINDSKEKSIIDINKFDTIITQNVKNINIFNNYIHDLNKIVISPLPDFKYSEQKIETNNDHIVILIIGQFPEIKGLNVLKEIYDKFKNKVKFIVFGVIDGENSIPTEYYKTINEFNNLLIKYKPNLILELTLWTETYSYSLTLSMITNLPILSLKKNFDSVVENRLSKYDKAYFFKSISDLDNLIPQVKQNWFYTVKSVLFYNIYWDQLFLTNIKEKENVSNINKYQIKPYAIYFPQFHEIKENNILFYPNYTDIKNLISLHKSDKYINCETPSNNVLQLKAVNDYNFKNEKIIQKQIDIITKYSINGFAIYYYFFSTNTITNKNMIMESVINMFFSNKIKMNGKKVFFIWANENWKDNLAFGNSIHQIVNNYDKNNLMANVNNLVTKYFKHENYLKIDNKPVFFIHHPWKMNNKEINMFYELLNDSCILNKFDGIHFVLNSMNGKYPEYTNYMANFNYKNSKTTFYDNLNKINILNYKNYINKVLSIKDYDIKTAVFDFDNRARMFKPDRLENATVCTENTEFDKIVFLNKIIESYNRPKKEIESIMLLNSWNEWGEKMAIEPSNEYKYYYLNLISSYLQNNY